MMNFTRFSLFSMAVLGAMFFSACKETPDTRTLADSSTQSDSKIKAKVRKVLGETELMRKDSDKWSKLRYGQLLAEKDRIRTGAESEAVMSVNDGTSLWIAELSDVTLDVEIFDSLRHDVSVNVTNGGVFFDVQKQQGRTIKFNTGVATAAIRGTVGFVYAREGQMVTSLKEGLVGVNSLAGATGDVHENQTLLVGKDGVIKNLNLRSSGTRALSMVLANVDIFGVGPHADSLEQALQAFDNDYAARQDEFKKKLNFRANPIPDTVLFPNVTLQARVNPGVLVTVMGETDTVPENGIYQRTVEWEEGTYGKKRFLVTCSDGDVEVNCFTWDAVYSNPQPAGDTVVVDSAAATEKTPAVDSAEIKAAAQKASAEKAFAEKAAQGKTLKNKAKDVEVMKAVDNNLGQAEPTEKKSSKNVKVSVKLAGSLTEKKHLDPPANEYKTKLKFSLAGITNADLSEIASVAVKHDGEVIQSFTDVSGLTYEVPLSIGLNTIAKYDIEVTMKNGKKVRTSKTYEVFCLRRNHMGKARNCVQYDKVEGGGCDPSHAEEYEAVKDQLKEE